MSTSTSQTSATGTNEVIASLETLKKTFTVHKHLGSFSPLPEGVTFDSQAKEERVLLFLRQNPIVNVGWILLVILLVLAPFFAMPLLPVYSLFIVLPLAYKTLFLVGWYLFVSCIVIEKILMWLFNSFIVTDSRIIDIDFYSIIFKEMNYAQISRIQDITIKTGGVLYSILNVGTVFVETAGSVPEFVFDNITRPSQVVQLLHELIDHTVPANKKDGV